MSQFLEFVVLDKRVDKQNFYFRIIFCQQFSKLKSNTFPLCNVQYDMLETLEVYEKIY